MTRTGRVVGCLLLLSLADSAHAADPGQSYPAMVSDDIKHVVTAPSRWENQEWKNLAWGALAVLGTAAVVDRPLRDAMRRQPADSNFMTHVERFGAEYSAGVLGGFYLVGAFGDNDKAMAVAQDGFSASLIASGMITPAIKFVAGRSRPRENVGTAHFKPFSGASSFPSGHTTQAFAIASVISGYYEETWIKCSSYSVAGLVGFARSYHDAHFASDVLAGALIGTLVGQSVVARNRTWGSGKVVLLPQATPEMAGLRLAGSF